MVGRRCGAITERMAELGLRNVKLVERAGVSQAIVRESSATPCNARGMRTLEALRPPGLASRN